MICIRKYCIERKDLRPNLACFGMSVNVECISGHGQSDDTETELWLAFASASYNEAMQEQFVLNLHRDTALPDGRTMKTTTKVLGYVA